MTIENGFNSVKVTFELRTRNSRQSDVAKNVAENVAKNVAENLTPRQLKIIALISENPATTRSAIASVLGVSSKTIERELSALSHIVRYVGPKRGGYWEILNTGETNGKEAETPLND
ncbi:MAG: hypothetical protein K2G35_02265 [Duncaniella sp.]|nr:hypothetical protein [Duncaniella sp.]